MKETKGTMTSVMTDAKARTKTTATPELRFPEFRDKGAWEVKRLEDVCRKITQGGTPDTSNHSYWNGTINWLTPAEMGKTGDHFMHTTARKITPLGFRNCSSDLLPAHSVIVSTRAPIGHLAINKSEMAINQGCKGLIPKDTTNHNFIYYFLLNFKFLLMDLGAGSTFKELTGNDLKKFKILFPSFKEQQKIADCLTSLDELISAEDEKLTALKEHKKGLLQKLFPAEGETTPELRFPEFRGKGAWEVKRLDNQGDFLPSLKGKRGEDFGGGNALFIPYLNVFKNTFINEEVLGSVNVSSKEKQNHVKKGDVFFTISSETPEEVGMSSVLLQNIKNCYLNSFCAMFRFSLGKAPNLAFLGYLLRHFSTRLYFSKHAQGVTRFNLSKDVFKNLPLYIPTLPEQQKIAGCFTSLDELISAQGEKLKALKDHKKGLMQQLFPSVSETTG